MLKIASWNVNSVRARLHNVANFIENELPDVLLLQETKCKDENFPYDLFESMRYNVVHCGEGARNGVAICSKHKISDVTSSFIAENRDKHFYAYQNTHINNVNHDKNSGIQECLALTTNIKLASTENKNDSEARFIRCLVEVEDINISPFYVASVYVPNGGASVKETHLPETETERYKYKLAFLKDLYLEMQSLYTQKETLIVGGDYNVIFSELDLSVLEGWLGHVTCTEDEMEALNNLLINNSYVDSFRLLNGNTKKMSWFDYRTGGFQKNIGCRIDYVLVSSYISDRIVSAEILEKYRAMAKPSDHCPVTMCIK